jgi:hypothetical protein
MAEYVRFVVSGQPSRMIVSVLRGDRGAGVQRGFPVVSGDAGKRGDRLGGRGDLRDGYAGRRGDCGVRMAEGMAILRMWQTCKD